VSNALSLCTVVSIAVFIGYVSLNPLRSGGPRRRIVFYSGSMTWHEGPLAALDLEATGVDTRTARIIEVGLFIIEADGSSRPLVDRLINPGVEVPHQVTELTGISGEDLLSNGGSPAEVLTETLAAVTALVDEGVPIVLYNANYDWPLLTNELVRHGLGPLPAVPPAILIDPLVLDRHVDRYRKGKRTLGSVTDHYGVRLDGAHRAAADAAATVGLARAIAERYPKVQVDDADLVTLQIEAHTKWKDSFNAYLTKVGASRPPITEEWPTG
jgi:DNA polymerase-3 subunit epsilon